MEHHGAATRSLILDTAQEMVQTRGYHAVSFRNIAEKVKIKAASIHYYFPSKELLARAMVQRYRDYFTAGRESIDKAPANPLQKLERYVGVLRDGFKQNGRMCLCGVLAAEASALPPDLAEDVRGFFTDNEQWLTRVLAAGRKGGGLQFHGSPEKNAVALFAGLEGALMTAWTFGDEGRLAFTSQWLLSRLKSDK